MHDMILQSVKQFLLFFSGKSGELISEGTSFYLAGGAWILAALVASVIFLLPRAQIIGRTSSENAQDTVIVWQMLRYETSRW